MGPDYQGDRGGGRLGRANVVGGVGQGGGRGGGDEDGGPGDVWDRAGGGWGDGNKLQI